MKTSFFDSEQLTFGTASMWAALAVMSPYKRYLPKMVIKFPFPRNNHDIVYQQCIEKTSLVI
jgi:hypothetical protein